MYVYMCMSVHTQHLLCVCVCVCAHMHVCGRVCVCTRGPALGSVEITVQCVSLQRGNDTLNQQRSCVTNLEMLSRLSLV